MGAHLFIMNKSEQGFIEIKETFYALQFMEFMAWFIKFHERYEFLKVHRVTPPYSYSWVHEKFDIHIHEFMVMLVFIFIGSCIFQK